MRELMRNNLVLSGRRFVVSEYAFGSEILLRNNIGLMINGRIVEEQLGRNVM